MQDEVRFRLAGASLPHPISFIPVDCQLALGPQYFAERKSGRDGMVTKR
jgi:hypothetical protein